MNAYIYGGTNRSTAYTSIIENNKQVTLNEQYMIEYEKGMLVVAYPNLNKNETEFAFSYWLGPKVTKT